MEMLHHSPAAAAAGATTGARPQPPQSSSAVAVAPRQECPPVIGLSSSQAAAGECGGHVASAQTAILMNGKHWYTADHVELAALFVHAKLSVPIILSLPRLLKSQHSGVIATRALHMR